jgi:signal transduction histidine kinase
VSFINRFSPRTITAQITGLVVIAVLLGVGIASAFLLYLFYSSQAGISPELVAATRDARIATIVKRVEETSTPEERRLVLQTTRWPSMQTREVPLASVTSAPRVEPHDPAFVDSIKYALEDTWKIHPLPNAPASDGIDSIAVKINDDAALVFEASWRPPLHNIVLIQTTCALAIITFIILFLSLYALRWITAPLSSIASAARSFGPFPDQDGILSMEGPREIAQVAEALNDMRKRVRTLVDERTKMLAAISHDLRTPLTRLRLRTERLDDPAIREPMLRDIATINDMLSETLAYLREGGRMEPVQLVDLPSLLQTICSQFSDIGLSVSYDGPDRFPFACRGDALTRAVTNVVDNGTKHAANVMVTLRALNDGGALIDVSDDGPGIPESARERVFEPFYKGDNARRSSGGGGFGLGLSIARDIVKRQGGEIELLENDPHGLLVRLTICQQREKRVWRIPADVDA